MPLRFSLAAWFSASCSHWILRNFGKVSTIAIARKPTSSTMAMPVASDHCHALPAIFVIAHMAIAGALMTTCMDRTMSICTCTTSFVERVMRLAVEKEFISSMENDSTLSNIAARSLLEKLAAMDEAR